MPKHATGVELGVEEIKTSRYLGDGVYATFDGYHVWLRIPPSPEHPLGGHIALEPAVIGQLNGFIDNLKKEEQTNGS